MDLLYTLVRDAQGYDLVDGVCFKKLDNTALKNKENINLKFLIDNPASDTQVERMYDDPYYGLNS